MLNSCDTKAILSKSVRQATTLNLCSIGNNHFIQFTKVKAFAPNIYTSFRKGKNSAWRHIYVCYSYKAFWLESFFFRFIPHVPSNFFVIGNPPAHVCGTTQLSIKWLKRGKGTTGIFLQKKNKWKFCAEVFIR